LLANGSAGKLCPEWPILASPVKGSFAGSHARPLLLLRSDPHLQMRRFSEPLPEVGTGFSN